MSHLNLIAEAQCVTQTGPVSLAAALTSITVENPRSGPVTAEITFPAATELEFASFAEGNPVEIQAGFMLASGSPGATAPIFSGYLARIEYTREGTTFYCEDECWRLRSVLIEQSWEQTLLPVIAALILLLAGVPPSPMVPIPGDVCAGLMDYNPAGMSALDALTELGGLIGWEFGFIPGTRQPWFGSPDSIARVQKPPYPYAVLGDNVMENGLKKTLYPPVSQVAVVYKDPGNTLQSWGAVFPVPAVITGKQLFVLRTGKSDPAAVLAEATRIYNLYLTAKFTGSLVVFGWPSFHAGEQFRLWDSGGGKNKPTDLGYYTADSVTHTINNNGFFTRVNLVDPGEVG